MQTTTRLIGTPAANGYTKNGLGDITRFTAKQQFELRLLAERLVELGIPFFNRGLVFASSDQNSSLDWNIHFCKWSGSFFWLMSVPVDGKVEHYSDVVLPQMRHEGNFREGLFLLSRINSDDAARLLGIQPVNRERIFKVTDPAAIEHINTLTKLDDLNIGRRVTVAAKAS